MAVTLSEIAKVAKCSRGAVCDILSRKDTRYSTNLRGRVLQAAAELGYVPNSAARAIRKGKFHRIAFIVTQVCERGQTNQPNVLNYLNAATDILAEEGYSLAYEPFHIQRDPDTFIEPPRLFSELGVDGVLALAACDRLPKALDDKLQNLGVPVIWINRETPDFTYVACDEIGNARKLTQYLIDLRHKRIAYFASSAPSLISSERRKGVSGQLEAAGLSTAYVNREISSMDLLHCMREVLTRPNRPTAVIAYNYSVYVAALHVAADLRLRVPDDLSLCYFASPWEQYQATRMTCMEVPEAQMANTAAHLLLGTIGNNTEKQPSDPIRGTLRIGQTTAPPNTEM